MAELFRRPPTSGWGFQPPTIHLVPRRGQLTCLLRFPPRIECQASSPAGTQALGDLAGCSLRSSPLHCSLMTSPRGSRWQGGWKLPEEAVHGRPQHKAHERLRGLCPEHHRSLLDGSRRRGFLFENRQSWRKDQVQEHRPALGLPAASWLRGRAELHAQHPASLRMPLTLGFPAGPAKGIMGLLRHSCLFSCCILTAAV